jgi:hypothetical protein
MEDVGRGVAALLVENGIVVGIELGLALAGIVVTVEAA